MRYKKGFSLLEVNISIVIFVAMISLILKLYIIEKNVREKTVNDKKVMEIVEMIKNEVKFNLSESEITSIFSEKKYINKNNLEYNLYSSKNIIDLLENSQDNEKNCEIEVISGKRISLKIHIYKNNIESEKYETTFSY